MHRCYFRSGLKLAMALPPFGPVACFCAQKFSVGKNEFNGRGQTPLFSGALDPESGDRADGDGGTILVLH